MGSCDFCKVVSEDQLKRCVCRKVSYCSKECQVKDWKSHKSSCPPYTIRESPGKGRGLFATRKIKEGQIILEEYPFHILRATMSLDEFKTIHYPNIADDTKARILELHDPAENLVTLDSETLQKLISNNPEMMFWMETRGEEICKIYRILSVNNIKICAEPDLYRDTNEAGLYHKLSHINHSCVPNASISWIIGDFKRRQARALMDIEKDEEILGSYRAAKEFIYGPREFRRQELLETQGFLCDCSECSLEGENLEENERLRAKYREKKAEIEQVMSSEFCNSGSLKKIMKLAQKKIKLCQKLNIRSMFVTELIEHYQLAGLAREKGVSCENDADTFKQEAQKYAKMYGDVYINLYRKRFNN